MDDPRETDSLSVALQHALDAQEPELAHGRRKRTGLRSRTISIRRIHKRALARRRLLYPDDPHWRPKTRGDCGGIERPCPFVTCRYHLYVDVHPVRGSIKFNFPELEVWEMTETCALDVAERGNSSLEEVGSIMNLTRERVRQVQTRALGALEIVDDADRLRDYVT